MKTPGSAHSPRRNFDYRGLITYLVVLSFLVMLISGAVMFLAPSGRVAKDIDWALLGIGRAEWQTLHLSFAVVFIAMGLSHLACNWRSLAHHLRDRASRNLTLKWEAVLALVVTVWLVTSAVVPWPPASILHDLNEFFRRTYWANELPANGALIVPSGVETDDGDPPITDPALPEHHPPIRADDACSDCHRQ